MYEVIAGIDLGTTNSAVCVVEDGAPRILPVHGQPTMPSAVGLDPTGKLIVGQAAKNQQISAPERTITSIKRLMGEDTKVTLGDRELSPEEVSALILKELKLAAETELGVPVKKAVITVPAFFNERQRKATQVAGELAGLDVVRIINEPTAAALAYGAGRQEGETMLVYDLGGGTFDVSLVRVESGVVEVKASHGDTHLGGDDFDEELVRLASERFRSRHRTEGELPDLVRRRLKGTMESAKIRLSEETFVQVQEEYLQAGQHLDTEVSRAEYEEMIEPWLEKTLTCLHSTLRDAGMTSAEVGKIMLVGGATRTPAVQDLLRERLGLEAHFEINPDLIVAMGAAVQGAIIAGQPQRAILVDITPHSYSVAVLDQNVQHSLVCDPIVNRNTPLPAKRAKTFYTLIPGQKEVNVEVYQGESALPEGNLLVGDFVVSGLSPTAPEDSPIIVEFHLDLNGMLKVTATEKSTRLAKTVVLDTRGQHLLDLKAARANLESYYDAIAGDSAEEDGHFDGADEEDSDLNQASLLATAKSLQQRAELLLDKGVSDDDAGEIRRLLDLIGTAITGQEWSLLSKHSDALGDVLFYLED
ncbi:Hsp70 family protein [Verrucomicrobium sp. BvORR034]|uniref:Hsp70 family protein n=1 Tax=Verrucomicrobium sp. BvORR034 TaxID=1396418 RepID=UPI0006787B86|nr:Hsp70 family protein [Verrucomicrobium sp. BvORR034]